MTNIDIVDEFYSLPPKYRTKDKLKQMLSAKEAKEKPKGAPCGRPHCLGDFKPMAPASLVEEMRDLIKRPKEVAPNDPAMDDNTFSYMKGQESVYNAFHDSITEILSRYRPASQTRTRD